MSESIMRIASAGSTQRDVARDLTLKALEGFTLGSVKDYKPEAMGEFIGIVFATVLKAVQQAER